MLTAWPIPIPLAYNAVALQRVPNSLDIQGDPHEIDAKATRGKCGSARCSAWFGVSLLGCEDGSPVLDEPLHLSLLKGDACDGPRPL